MTSFLIIAAYALVLLAPITLIWLGARSAPWKIEQRSGDMLVLINMGVTTKRRVSITDDAGRLLASAPSLVAHSGLLFVAAADLGGPRSVAIVWHRLMRRRTWTYPLTPDGPA